MTAIRWIRPAWLTIDQAEIYCGLPPYILRGLLASKLLRRTGTKIYRDSIDSMLLEAALNRKPIFWGAN